MLKTNGAAVGADQTLGPDTPVTTHLKTAENVALCTIRAWVCSVTHQSHAASFFSQGLERAGCVDAAAPLSALLHILVSVAKRKLEIHKPSSAGLSDDEKRLLHILAAQQTGHALEAFDVLSTLLPGAAVRLALAQSQTVAACFAQAGLCFPERAWKLDELCLTHRLRAPRSTNTCVRYMLH